VKDDRDLERMRPPIRPMEELRILKPLMFDALAVRFDALEPRLHEVGNVDAPEPRLVEVGKALPMELETTLGVLALLRVSKSSHGGFAFDVVGESTGEEADFRKPPVLTFAEPGNSRRRTSRRA